jgi:hypothetical protein
MRNHMLKYHVLLPLAVMAVLVVFGVPLGRAFGYGIAAGCVSMVAMMFTGGHDHAHHEAHEPSEHHAHRSERIPADDA